MRVGVIHFNSHAIFEMLEFFTPWCQIGELLISPALIWPLVQDVLQVVIYVEIMSPGHFYHRVDHGTCFSSLHTVTEQPVLPPDGKRTDRILAQAVGKAAPSVLQIGLRGLAAVLHIGDCLSHPCITYRSLLVKP